MTTSRGVFGRLLFGNAEVLISGCQGRAVQRPICKKEYAIRLLLHHGIRHMSVAIIAYNDKKECHHVLWLL